MRYRVTCPHCETALHVSDKLGSAQVTCSHCLGLIPNPGPNAGTAPGTAAARTVKDAAARLRSRGIGCGALFLVALVWYAGGVFAASVLRASGCAAEYQEYPGIIWCWTGVLGFLGLSTQHVWRGLRRRIGKDRVARYPLLGPFIVFVALLTGFFICGGVLSALPLP